MSDIIIVAIIQGINFIRFRLSKAETFSVKICVKRIDNKGGQTFIKKRNPRRL